MGVACATPFRNPSLGVDPRSRRRSSCFLCPLDSCAEALAFSQRATPRRIAPCAPAKEEGGNQEGSATSRLERCTWRGVRQASITFITWMAWEVNRVEGPPTERDIPLFPNGRWVRAPLLSKQPHARGSIAECEKALTHNKRCSALATGLALFS